MNSGATSGPSSTPISAGISSRAVRTADCKKNTHSKRAIDKRVRPHAPIIPLRDTKGASTLTKKKMYSQMQSGDTLTA